MKVTSQSKSQSQYAFQEFDLCPVLPFSHMIRICTNICYHTFKSFLDAIAPTPVSGWVSQWVIVSDLEIAIASPSFANCFGNFLFLYAIAIAVTPVSGWVSQWVIDSFRLKIAIASPSFASLFLKVSTV